MGISSVKFGSCHARSNQFEIDMFNCECESPGKCPVWRKEMGPELHSICRGDPDAPIHESVTRETYLDAWIRELADQDPPSLYASARPFMIAHRNHIAAGSPEAPAAIAAERLALCEECDLLDPKTLRCRSCGCYVERKTKWADAECPLPEPAKRWRALSIIPQIIP